MSDHTVVVFFLLVCLFIFFVLFCFLFQIKPSMSKVNSHILFENRCRAYNAEFILLCCHNMDVFLHANISAYISSL